MTIVLSVVCFVFLNLIFISSAWQNDYFELELVQVVFRHGDRVAQRDEIYKTDPYDSVFKAGGYGQLTKAGLQREYKIGRMLRERYDNFLGDSDPNQVYAFSSNYDRTKMSLQLVLAGLYPPTIKTTWNQYIPWIPIPADYKENEYNFLTTVDSCPNFDDLLKQAENSPEIQTKLQKYHHFAGQVKNKTKISSVRPFTIFLLYNNIYSALNMGLRLPNWCSEEDYKNIQEIASIAYDAMVFTERMKRMVVGPTIEQFVKNIRDNDKKENGKKIYLYSAHDINIGSFTRAHNITGIPSIPEYGSALMFEKLRGINNATYVRMALYTGVGEKIIPLKLENCGNECLLSDYMQIVQSLLPSDEVRKCISPYRVCDRQPRAVKKRIYEDITTRLFAEEDLPSFKYGKKL